MLVFFSFVINKYTTTKVNIQLKLPFFFVKDKKPKTIKAGNKTKEEFTGTRRGCVPDGDHLS